METAQSGDDAAYQELLQSLLPLLRAAVRRRRSFLSEADQEDLVQDVLLSIHADQSRRPFLPWAYAIMSNRLADGGRRHERRRRVLEAGQEFHETFPAIWTNIEDVADRDRETLLKEIERLPKNQKQAVELLKLKDCHYERHRKRVA